MQAAEAAVGGRIPFALHFKDGAVLLLMAPVYGATKAPPTPDSWQEPGKRIRERQHLPYKGIGYEPGF